ncbi:MAG: hypothetical protein HXY23_14185 [Parvularculaceae bacterium]|nr:hypothetical protein [Parvularculaceae bacterium]
MDANRQGGPAAGAGGLRTEVAFEQDSQIIAASHSEVVLAEAGDKHILVAFVGKPHRIDDRGKSQVGKALREIGFVDYFRAEQLGWVLYLEGSTDLSILRELARKLEHPAAPLLESPFVYYVGNKFAKAKDHFWGLREAKSDFVGIVILDRQDNYRLESNAAITEMMWRRREIENYLCDEEVLIEFARSQNEFNDLPLFADREGSRHEAVMREVIADVSRSLELLSRPSPWSSDIKATDDFLDPLFENYYRRLSLPNLLRKTDYHVLTRFLPVERIDPEIVEKLDAIVEIARRANPVTGDA